MGALSSVSSHAGPSSAAASGPRPANLDAEKADCERQLADWVHCVSASTPKGKAKIEELSDKLSAIKANIKKTAEAARPAAPVGVASRPTATLGNRVDVLA